MLFLFTFSYYNLAELHMDSAKNDTAFSARPQHLVFVKSEKNKQTKKKSSDHSYTCAFYVSQASGSIQLMSRRVDVAACFRCATEHCQLGSAVPSHSLDRTPMACGVGQ